MTPAADRSGVQTTVQPQPGPPAQTALVAVDWGTTSLRGARLDSQGQVLEEVSSAQGILSVAANTFATVFEANFSNWTGATGTFSLLSGMVGSKQGWAEAAYCPCPAGFDEIAAQLKWIPPRRIAIVPGLSCEWPHAPDVMRGEEVQILGAMQLSGVRDGVFVLPGTHSKWAQVKDGRVTAFKTCMTGEFYALLSQHSLLSRTLTADAPFDPDAFAQGVALAGTSGGLLHTAFSVRTLSLFSRMSAAASTSYLSGLVIGEELHVQALDPGSEVIVIGSSLLTHRYSLALAQRGVRSRLLGSEATWAGLHSLARTLRV